MYARCNSGGRIHQEWRTNELVPIPTTRYVAYHRRGHQPKEWWDHQWLEHASILPSP
jgi:hypothetical protein